MKGEGMRKRSWAFSLIFIFISSLSLPSLSPFSPL